MKVFLEYIWLDGSEPQQLRSKTKVVDYETIKPQEGRDNPFTWDLPEWSFDGSSTLQAKAGSGENTDCVLKPVFITDDPFRGTPHKLVLCTVFNPDGETPHETNTRAKLRELVINNENLKSQQGADSPWFGWEQEYTLTYKSFKNKEKPLGHDENPRPQGDYYCGIGSNNVIGRDIAEEHMEKCIQIGLSVSGLNAEVMLGQWEYQIGPVTAINGSDQLWMSRYILQRVAEKHNVNVSLHPKPLKGDWNGSGCHVNFSTKEMREDGGLEHILDTMEKLESRHSEFIEVYGLHNETRLSGEHETSSIDEFSYGFSTRDTSVRIPIQTKINGKGYFEDRRPASNCDPYLVSHIMLETVHNTVETVEV